jgi:catechol 2,3-dioxygenase-like lactoylglutathione lyase family enzyme
MTIDHLSFGTHDLEATTAFYAGQLGFELLIHEWILLEEGGRIDHAFFDCGGSCCLAFMQWIDVPGVPSHYDTGINRGLGVPAGTFHFAFRCDSLEALEQRRLTLLNAGVLVGDLIDLHPYRSFFFDDPVNGLRLEYTVRLGQPGEVDRDPNQRQIKTNLNLFQLAAIPGDSARS